MKTSLRLEKSILSLPTFRLRKEVEEYAHLTVNSENPESAESAA